MLWLESFIYVAFSSIKNFMETEKLMGFAISDTIKFYK